jgi:Ca2+-binding RTX toxin-like protein
MAIVRGTAGADILDYFNQALDPQNTFHGYGGDDYILASTSNDTVYGGAGHDDLIGNDGNDWLYGEAGNDHLANFGSGTDRMYGGTGDDTYEVHSSGDIVIELANQGYDRVDNYRITYTLPSNVEALYLWGYNNGQASGNKLDNHIVGDATDNVLRGLDGHDDIFGDEGDDTIFGGNQADELDGGWGHDIVRGGAGDDVLLGSPDSDILIGGTGNDVFRFGSPSASALGSRDTIRSGDGEVAFRNPGNAAGDRIDVSLIDADATAGGNQAFLWGGTTQKGKGYLWVENVGGDTYVRGNINNGAAPEIEIEIEDAGVVAAQYRVPDFIL